MAAEKSPRKERERQQHRQEILSAALRLFAEKGFHSVSMQEIAAAAEFATGTLYNFFASKEDLFFELLDATAEEGLRMVLAALDGPGDERRRLSHFIHIHTRVVREHGAAFRLYLMESQGRCLPGPRVEAYKKEIDRRIVTQLAGVIAAGIDKGLFHNIDPVIAGRCLFASLEPFVLAAIENPEAVDLGSDLKKIETVFFTGLLKPSGERRDK